MNEKSSPAFGAQGNLYIRIYADREYRYGMNHRLPLTPVSQERVGEPDIIRGFALLGILLVNMSFFATRVCFFAESCSSCFWSV